MKRTLSWTGLLAFIATVGLIFAGCATADISVLAQRTPTLDTMGIQRVAVMPFTTTVSGAGQLTQELTSQVMNALQATNAFTLVSHETINAVQARGESIEAYADALFRGRITHFEERTDMMPAGRRQVHIRVVEVVFEYYLVRARDGSIVGPVRRAGDAVSVSENMLGLQSGATLARTAFQEQLGYLYRDVIPHTVTVTRALERGSSIPFVPLRRQMDAANARIRAGDIVGARNAYIAIWQETGNIAAAVNVATLFEATGDLEDGISFMEQVFSATGASQAQQKLAHLNSELAELMSILAFGDVQGLVDRVTYHAISEISRILPEDPRMWIHPTADLSIVNDVIDNMISSFLRSGYTIVDRQVIDLILAEQDLHLDGSVADSDFLSIGNLAGANIVAIIGVTGSGPARRLQVRVLDIATATLRMQSGTGIAWRL